MRSIPSSASSTTSVDNDPDDFIRLKEKELVDLRASIQSLQSKHSDSYAMQIILEKEKQITETKKQITKWMNISEEKYTAMMKGIVANNVLTYPNHYVCPNKSCIRM